MEEWLRNKRIGFLTILVVMIQAGCNITESLKREVIIRDSSSKKIIPGSYLELSTKDTVFIVEIGFSSDSESIIVPNGRYSVKAKATGYSGLDTILNITTTDNFIVIDLIAKQLNSVKEDWEGSSVTFEDSLGNIRVVKHKPEN